MKVQSSELYKKMLSTYALKIRGRMISLTCLLLNMFSSVSRLSIASFVSDKEPSSLHFFPAVVTVGDSAYFGFVCFSGYFC